jgi:hypothetical protein
MPSAGEIAKSVIRGNGWSCAYPSLFEPVVLTLQQISKTFSGLIPPANPSHCPTYISLCPRCHIPFESPCS